MSNDEDLIEGDDKLLDDEDEQDSDIGEDIDRYWPPPTKDSLELAASFGGKTVSAFAFNNAGSRIVAGGHEFEVRIWDFQALDRDRPEPINCVQPSGQAVIKQLEFSPDDQLILVVSGSCQAVVVGKDGTSNRNNQMMCPKGDQYIADMAKTKGHVQMLNDGCWNPKEKGSFLTCSNDSTIRLWDLNKMEEQKTVIKTRSPVNGVKTIPNVSKYSRDSLSIIAGCNDGSIMTWDTRKKFYGTSSCIRNAHLKGSEITGIDYSYSGHTICSRSEDETCKVWDLRKLKEPTAIKSGLKTSNTITDCCFSPDDKYVMTGTSCASNEPGQLHFMDATDLAIQQSIDVDSASVLRVRWHPKINHIGYSRSDGRIVIGCDGGRSLGGLLNVDTGRGLKRKKYKSASSIADVKKIITPHALPLFRDESTSSSFAKIRQDPKRSYKPEIPISTNENGRIKCHGSTLSSYIAKNLALAKKTNEQSHDNK